MLRNIFLGFMGDRCGNPPKHGNCFTHASVSTSALDVVRRHRSGNGTGGIRAILTRIWVCVESQAFNFDSFTISKATPTYTVSADGFVEEVGGSGRRTRKRASAPYHAFRPQ